MPPSRKSKRFLPKRPALIHRSKRRRRSQARIRRGVPVKEEGRLDVLTEELNRAFEAKDAHIPAAMWKEIRDPDFMRVDDTRIMAKVLRALDADVHGARTLELKRQQILKAPLTTRKTVEDRVRKNIEIWEKEGVFD